MKETPSPLPFVPPDLTCIMAGCRKLAKASYLYTRCEMEMLKEEEELAASPSSVVRCPACGNAQQDLIKVCSGAPDGSCDYPFPGSHLFCLECNENWKEEQ